MSTATIVGTSEQVAQYAAAVFDPSDIVEIRAIDGGKVQSLYFPAAELAANADAIRSRFSGWNIYVGVNPRPRKGATGDDCIIVARCVFLDFDGITLGQVAKRLADAGMPEPTIVISSGHGYHVYWLLTEPMTDLKAWRRLMEDMTAALGADRKCVNPERIMRLPGYLNVKKTPHVPCEIIECNCVRQVEFAEIRELIPPRPVEPPKATRAAGASPRNRDTNDRREERCRKYLERCPDSISGSHGHDAFFRAACETFRFDLSDAERARVLDWFNAAKCQPAWNEKEVAHKIQSAEQKVRGAGEIGIRLRQREDQWDRWESRHHGASSEAAPSTGVLTFDPKDPVPTARKFLKDNYDHPDAPTLRHDGDTFYAWDTRWAETKEAAIRAVLYPYLEQSQKYVKQGETEKFVPFAPTPASVNNVIDPLKSITFINQRPPCWLADDSSLPDPRSIIVASNGLVELNPDAGAKLIRPPTPLFFSPNALDYPFIPEAATPETWLWLLNKAWPDDQEQIDCLQEWFGYCMVPDTRLQKAMLMVGPKRAGKGTIARTLTRVVGAANVCGPTLSGLATNFGLWALIGKLVAIISDARLSGRTDSAIITERLLAITGEDLITIDRKNLEPVETRLLVRMMILTNELPRLADASGALASRFLVLTLRESFYGHEDTTLEERINQELPGILLWAIEGWRRLQQRGHFIQPQSSADAINELNDLASPISAFVREWCHVEPGACIAVKDLYDAWCAWCEEQGRQPGIQQVFGRDLRAAFPGIATRQPTIDGERVRQYEGIALTATAAASAAQWRSRQPQSRGMNP